MAFLYAVSVEFSIQKQIYARKLTLFKPVNLGIFDLKPVVLTQVGGGFSP